MRALRGILFLYHSTINYKSYNFMGVPDVPPIEQLGDRRPIIINLRDGLKVIKHCDGDCSAVIDFWIDAGIDCLDPIDPGANFKMADFNRRYGDRICLKGNISCTGARRKELSKILRQK